MKITHTLLMAVYAGLSIAEPAIWARTVTALDPEATQQAQQRDAEATRVFSNTHIKTFNGKCLFVDKFSGDFRENLTPVRVAECGTTNGQGWDLVTAGKHNDVANSTLIVSTLTNACVNFDPRRNTGDQVTLFSCGGRADGSGLVADSQLFSFTGGSGIVTFQPWNAIGSCLVAEAGMLNIGDCNEGDSGQSFILEGNNTGVWKAEINSTAASQALGIDTQTSRTGDSSDQPQDTVLIPQMNAAQIQCGRLSG